MSNTGNKNVLEGIDDKVNVDEHGFVQLITVSPSNVNNNDPLGVERMIIAAARVSYSGLDVQNRGQPDINILRFMYQHGHSSPFEHSFLTFSVKCPIFVARQWFRHRTGSYNEISGRYAELPEEVWMPPADELRGQSSSNRQCSEGLPDDVAVHGNMQRVMHKSFEVYREALAAGVSREMARCVLPLSTYTQFYFSMNLHNMLRFLKLRMAPDAQPEIQAYANVIASFVEKLFPHTYQAFLDYTLNAVTLSGLEVEALRRSSLVSNDAQKYLSGATKRETDAFVEKLKKLRKQQTKNK